MEKRILIVEDHADVRQMLAAILESDGYSVYTAADGQQGLKAVEKDCPDLIVTDINMPRMDGIEMVRTLRGRAECNRLPILVVSAYGSGSLREAIDAGADQTMHKPIDCTLLAETIARLLR